MSTGAELTVNRPVEPSVGEQSAEERRQVHKAGVQSEYL